MRNLSVKLKLAILVAILAATTVAVAVVGPSSLATPMPRCRNWST